MYFLTKIIFILRRKLCFKRNSFFAEKIFVSPLKKCKSVKKMSFYTKINSAEKTFCSVKIILVEKVSF